MPTNRKAKKALLALIPPLKEGIIFELGSGFGTLAIPLARQFPDKLCIAYEISPFPYFYSLILSKILKINNLKIYRRDYLKCSLEEASLCVCYLCPRAMDLLQKKFEKELSSQTVVISNTFSLPQWRAEKVVSVSDLYHSKIFLYRKQL